MPQPPEFLFLQFYGDQEPFTDADPVSSGEVTWSVDKIHGHDVGYMRTDRAMEMIDADLDRNERICRLVMDGGPTNWRDEFVTHTIIAAILTIGFLGGVLVASLS